MSTSPLLRSKKEVPDTADPQQVPTPGVDLSVLDSDVIARVPSPVAEQGRGENQVAQPVNPTANAAANALANAAANAPANAPGNAAGNAVNNTANATNIQENAAPNPGYNAGAQPPLIQASRAEGSQRHHIRDEVEIARRANYDREHGVPDALDTNNPIQATDLRIMHDQELL
jgi:hypothetical protein